MAVGRAANFSQLTRVTTGIWKESQIATKRAILLHPPEQTAPLSDAATKPTVVPATVPSATFAPVPENAFWSSIRLVRVPRSAPRCEDVGCTATPAASASSAAPAPGASVKSQ